MEKKLQLSHISDEGLLGVTSMFDTVKVQLHMLCYF